MVKDNITCPLPVRDEKVMRYIGKRTKYQIENMTNAQYGDVYYCEAENTFYLSTGDNDWLTWGTGSGPTPEDKITIYYGTLIELPTSETELSNLTSAAYKPELLVSGIPVNVSSNNDYVVFACKTSECNLISIFQGGFETISNYEANKVTLGEYTFWCSEEVVFDPEGDEYTLKYEV